MKKETVNRWIKASDELPQKSAYYLTLYHNKDEDSMLYKAFVYNVKEKKWVFRFNPDVKLWWDKPFEYYVPCQTQEGVEPIPKELL